MATPARDASRRGARGAAAAACLAMLCGGDAGNPASDTLKTPSTSGAPTFELKRESFAGPIGEVVPAGPYTYFSLVLPGAEKRWLVVLGKEHRRATWLSVESVGKRRRFLSRRLNRTFERLYFAYVKTSNEWRGP